MIRLTSLLAVVLFACTPRVEHTDSIPTPMAGNGQTLTGTVRIVGSAPVNVQVVLRPTQGQDVRLTGALLGELERLSGVEVAVRGAIRPSPDPIVSQEIDVAEYQIVSVDGRPVVMGEIIAIEGGWTRLETASGEEVFLSGAPPAFRVGQKVWVQGPRSIAVQSYGMIRP